MDVVGMLSKALLMSEFEIVKFINTAPYRYKQYEIPKRNGNGTRIIAQPTSELKTMQRFVVDKLQEFLPVHKAAMAYRKDLSIKDNALAHAKNDYLLKLDFKDFFNSIRPSDFDAHYQSFFEPLDSEKALIFKKLFFWKKKGGSHLALSIGAPSSPFLSNSIMYPFDVSLSEECEKRGVTYTRYADDITLTTKVKGVLSEFPEIIEQISSVLAYPKLELNKAKTVFSSKANNRHVTGLTLTNDNNLSLGRQKKRVIRAQVFTCINGGLSDSEVDSLRGHLSFVQHVEPVFFLSLVKKYGMKNLSNIVRGVKKAGS